MGTRPFTVEPALDVSAKTKLQPLAAAAAAADADGPEAVAAPINDAPTAGVGVTMNVPCSRDTVLFALTMAQAVTRGTGGGRRQQ
jgi:hypothetical protein